ncbi:MAG TPA: glycosyltransferase [Opitutaceae bacterium]|nr:glycosyltransferase [Opitutaceae bacterium]
MKFLQLLSTYGEYVREFYVRYPGIGERPYAEQNALLIRDGYSIVHMFARYLGPFGFETGMIFTDCETTQKKWVAEQGVTLTRPENWRHEIAARQVNAFRPDILYLTEPVYFDRRFLDLLDHRPRMVLGWKAAAIPPATNWHGFDLIVSNFSPTFARARELGAKRAEFITPGFPDGLREELPDDGKTWDVSFVGSVSSEHQTRTDYLNSLAKAQLGPGHDFSLGYFLRTAEPDIVPLGVALHNQGTRWGEDMHRILKGSRIALNIGIDLAKGETGNMRMIEATGLGSFLLTEYQDNIRRYFEPGLEVETFRSPGELAEKIRHYLGHEAEREAIARRGRERCLRDFSMSKSAKRLVDLIRETVV